MTTNFVEFSRPFIESAKKVFETMVYTKITTGQPEIKSGKSAKGDISAVIGITGVFNKEGTEGDFKGQFVISFPEATYIKVAGAMLMEEYKEFNDEIADVGAEICNMIMGNAKAGLKNMGYTFDMSVPTTIHGKDHSITYPKAVTIVVIPIKSDHGDFYFEVCYQE